MNIGEATGLVLKLFFLLTPFFILSVFISVCGTMELGEQKRLAVRVSLAVLVATIVIYLFGDLIFRYLGITLQSFQIGAGLVLMLSGIDMVRGSIPEGRKCDDGNDPAVVPLAIPTTVGPGTIGTLLVMGAEVQNNRQRLVEIGAIAVAALGVGVLLYFAGTLERILKRKGLSILSKLTGMFIVALAAQVIFTGIKGMLF